jgi:hypothetical protein
MTLHRIDHQVAARAEQTLATIAGGKPLTAEVISRLEALPAMLRRSGLVATLALCAARAASKDRALATAYAAVGRALRTEITDELGGSADTWSYRVFADHNPADQARAFARADALAGWLRRLAEAEKAEAETTGEDGAGDA